MATRVPSNDGLDWGLFPSAAELPNVSGSSTQSQDVRSGARAMVAGVGEYVCRIPTQNGAAWDAAEAVDADDVTYTPTTPGDWPNPDPTTVQEGLDDLAEQVTDTATAVAAIAVRSIVGPFSVAAVAVGVNSPVFGAATASAWVPPRACSITGVSGILDAAAADDDIQAAVFINGAPTGLMTFLAAGATKESLTFAAGTYPVVAEDTVNMTVVGGAALSNTPALTLTFEVTYS